MNTDIAELRKELGRLVGVWSGAGEVFANPWGPAGRTTGEWRFWLDAGSCNLIHDYREIRDGGHVFEGHGVITVDPDAAEYVWFWFDTYGFPPLSPARGKWEGDVLTLRKSTPRGLGQSSFSILPGALDYAVASRPVGAPEFQPVSSGRYERRGNA